MVQIFNLHDDIGYDMYLKAQQGIWDPWQYHQDKLKKGGIRYTTVACYFQGDETWEQVQKEILYVEEIIKCQSDVVFITECHEPLPSDKIVVMLTVEGLGAITENGSQRIRWLYDHGVRMASLTWNDANSLATGVNGDVCRGVSELGWEVLNEMERLGMILDVSHLNEMSFWQVIAKFTSMLLASHSNARALCHHARNLTDQQIRAIACRGGLIGINAVRKFVSCNPMKQTVQQMAMHARHISNLAGVEAVAIGFDFLDYYEDEIDEMVAGLEDATKAQNLMEALRKNGFTDEEIGKIASGNVIRFLHRNQ